jgi:hypothetical protein
MDAWVFEGKNLNLVRYESKGCLKIRVNEKPPEVRSCTFERRRPTASDIKALALRRSMHLRLYRLKSLLLQFALNGIT